MDAYQATSCADQHFSTGIGWYSFLSPKWAASLSKWKMQRKQCFKEWEIKVWLRAPWRHKGPFHNEQTMTLLFCWDYVVYLGRKYCGAAQKPLFFVGDRLNEWIYPPSNLEVLQRTCLGLYLLGLLSHKLQSRRLAEDFRLYIRVCMCVA